MFGGGDELRGGILGGEVTSSREINHKKQAATKCASIEVFTRANHSGYIGIRLICVTPMYVAVKYIGRGLENWIPMYI